MESAEPSAGASSARIPPDLLPNLHTDADRLRRYRIDGLVPQAVAQISSVADVEQAHAVATAHDLAVIALGGRTMLGLGMPPRRYDLALDMAGLNQIVDYEPDDFTITVEAGMALADLQRHLAVNGQVLPLDHPRFERATLGGLCAVGRGGLRRNSAGSPRDWLIGMRMVKADGTSINGGGRVVKNVSGYDLPKLFAGSLGTLGALVELTFKLRPQPASDQIVALSAPTFELALTAARAASQAAPFLNACVALSADAAASAIGLGAKILTDQPSLLLRASGLESAATEVLAQAVQAAREAGLEGPERTTSAIVETWQAVVDLECHTAEEDTRLRLGVPPSHLQRAQEMLSRYLPAASSWIAAADSGLLFVEVPAVDAETIVSLRRELGPLQGRLTIESAPLSLKQTCDIWGPAGPGARLMHNVKEQFDPRGTLNPGRYVDAI